MKEQLQAQEAFSTHEFMPLKSPSPHRREGGLYLPELNPLLPTLPATPDLKQIYSDEQFWKEVEANPGVRLEIPRQHIYGIQRKDEYEKDKTQAVMEALQADGVEFLREHPVLLCALSNQDVMTLALIDGHHRVRYAGLYGIQMIPSIVYTPDKAAPILNKSSKTSQFNSFTAANVVPWLDQGINEALASFKTIPDYKQPRPIPQARNVIDLQRRFRSF